jgi:hypothetical protein
MALNLRKTGGASPASRVSPTTWCSATDGRLMVLVFIMVALGGCQNPGRFEAALASTAAMD